MLSVTPTEEEQMKTIRIQITDQERQRLLELRQKSGDYRMNEHWRFFIARMVGVRGKLRIC